MNKKILTVLTVKLKRPFLKLQIRDLIWPFLENSFGLLHTGTMSVSYTTVIKPVMAWLHWLLTRNKFSLPHFISKTKG